MCAPIRAEEGLLGVLCPPNSSTPYRELPSASAIGGYPTPSQVAALGVDPAVLDAEGRCLVIEFPAFVLFGVYSPANSNGLRDDFRLGFLTSLDTRIRNLAKMGKNVILTGDLNVSRDLIDTAKAEDHMKSEGITYDEYLNMPNRRIFNQLLLNGKVSGERDEERGEPILYDLCREFHPKREGMFTHWEQKINARPGNFGSRIDFILCSISIKDWFQEANIQEGLMGSDHCPVYALTKDKVLASWGRTTMSEEAGPAHESHILDIMNPPGMFKDGVRLREYDTARDVPALSGKLFPEFTKRRNIRDMFSKKPAVPQPEATLSSARNESQSQEEFASSQFSTISAVDQETITTAEMSKDKGSSFMNGKTESIPSPLNTPEKRRASASASPSKPIKRSKSSLSAATSKTSKSQQSLKGFFLTRSKPEDPGVAKETAPAASSSSSENVSSRSPPARSPLPSEIYDPDPRATQEASKESWTKLFSKKPAPRCEHGEPCITLTTKKPGVNCGRQFWICPRPIGPSGQKEVGTQWRCGVFIWSSDWKGD